jgi:hypothetical protein
MKKRRYRMAPRNIKKPSGDTIQCMSSRKPHTVARLQPGRPVPSLTHSSPPFLAMHSSEAPHSSMIHRCQCKSFMQTGLRGVVSGWCCISAWRGVSCTVAAPVTHERVSGWRNGCYWLSDTVCCRPVYCNVGIWEELVSKTWQKMHCA